MGPLACGHRGARRCPRGCWHRTEACLVVEVIPGACGARTPRGPGRQLLRFKGGVDVLWPVPPPLGPLRERRTLPPVVAIGESRRLAPPNAPGRPARSPDGGSPADVQGLLHVPFQRCPVPRPSTGHPCRHYHGMSLRRTGTCRPLPFVEGHLVSPCLAQGHLRGTSEPSWNKALTHVFEAAEDRESPLQSRPGSSPALAPGLGEREARTCCFNSMTVIL